MHATRVLWINLTGSGNETAAHLLESNRITLMFCSFGPKPLILRLYGKAQPFHDWDNEWDELATHFSKFLGARQIVDVSIDLVQTSCGFGVPEFELKSQRPTLPKWAEHKGRDGIREYWQEKNTKSLDNKETGIFHGQ